MNGLLQGLRIVVTQAEEFMGPALCQVLSFHGATVLADKRALHHPDAPRELVQSHGHIDILVANLAMTAPSTIAAEVQDIEWSQVFDVMVHPLPRLLREVIPQMKSRGRGKFLVMGSASALRGMKRASSYSASRGAQLSWVQAVGVELAALNIQVNAIAQNFVENPTYFPLEVQANPRFVERLQREVPLGRLVKAEEDAEFVAYLCSDKANCFVGQVFPVCGGWVQR